ncbi:MAG TPA: hypothetical protein VKA84_24750 [Gemmatimonadaceae bacterium]|nr:hypothetical protein [Gemmatimonadaceae bacterium]
MVSSMLHRSPPPDGGAWRPTCLVLVLSLALGACGDSPDSPTEPGLAAGEWIAFTSLRDGNQEIYVMRPDGTDARRLTHDPEQDFAPSWSPDGQQIAFVSYRDTLAHAPGTPTRHVPHVYLMRADGSELRRLGQREGAESSESAPRWSPDGQRIAFSTPDPNGQNYQVVVANVDGSGQAMLVTEAYPEYSLVADWSPDGGRLLYLTNVEGDGWRKPYVMNADGTGRRPLVRTCPFNTVGPRWSPDGGRLAFACDTSYGAELYLAEADGSDPVRLSAPTGPLNYVQDLAPTWSPDGTQLAFWSDRVGDGDVYAVSADGGPSRRITQSPGSDMPGDWVRTR